MNENQLLPAEVAQIAESVSVEKRTEVQTVLNQVFNGVSRMREQLDSVSVTDENDKVNMKLANTIRLGVRQVRLDAEKTFDAKRAEVQQQMLSFKTEDSLWLKAKQTMQILTKEIEENARWKEETKERFEKEQKELKVQQRIFKVSKFAPEMARTEFENMSDETFELFFNSIEKIYNDRIEAEAKAEAERIAFAKAEAERIETQRIENERLKDEAIRIAKEREVERLALEKERAEMAKIQAEKDAETKRIVDELQSKKDAEIKAENERKALEEKNRKEAEKLAKSPIKKQLSVWVNSFEIAPTIDNETAKEITEKFNSFKSWALAKVESI